jgi:hypothetical protein
MMKVKRGARLQIAQSPKVNHWWDAQAQPAKPGFEILAPFKYYVALVWHNILSGSPLLCGTEYDAS